MKLEGYEYCASFATPAYYFEEGMDHEEYWVDSQNLVYHKFMDTNDYENKKWYIISPYKPIKEKPTKENIKWLVEECYLDFKNNENTHEFYEWDFNKHCIKYE